MEGTGFRPRASPHSFLVSLAGGTCVLSPPVTICKWVGWGLGRRPGGLAVRTAPLSCEPTWDLHSAPHLAGHVPRPLHSQVLRGVPHLLCVQSKEFNFSICPTHPLAGPWSPPCPCHRAEGSLPDPRGEGPPAHSHLHTWGPWGLGSLPSCPALHPWALQGDGGPHPDTTDPGAAGLRLLVQAGPRAVSTAAAGQSQAPTAAPPSVCCLRLPSHNLFVLKQFFIS